VFGRATIRLGIGPHSSAILLSALRQLLGCIALLHCDSLKKRGSTFVIITVENVDKL